MTFSAARRPRVSEVDASAHTQRDRAGRTGDIALVLALVTTALLEFAMDRKPSPLEVVVVAISILPLLWRRHYPVAVIGVVCVAFAPLAATGVPSLASNVAVLVAAYSGVVHARRGIALVAAGTAAVVGWSIGMALVPSTDFDTWLVSTAWVGVPLVLGAVMRAQVRRAVQAERLTAEAAVILEEERERIAREIHDIVAHALAVVVLHARGGQEAHRHGDEAAAAQALGVVETVGSQALGEMRRLVSLIRAPQDAYPTPTLRYLEDLVDSVRSAGLTVDLDVRGDLTAVPSGMDAAAFRFVHEALTNVIKHAAAAPAQVRVRITDAALELEVQDQGPGPMTASGGSGHGLVGMSERVAVYGGQFASGAGPDRGFRVWALLPIGPS